MPTPTESGATPAPTKKCRCSDEAAAQGAIRRRSDEAAAAAQGAIRRRQYLAQQLNCRTTECPRTAAPASGCRVPNNDDPVDRIVEEGLRAIDEPDDDEDRWRRRTKTPSRGAVYEPDYYDDQADTRNWLQSRNQQQQPQQQPQRQPPPRPPQQNTSCVDRSGEEDFVERNAERRLTNAASRRPTADRAREERARRARERRRRVEEAARSFERVRRDFRALERSVQREAERLAREERRLRRAREYREEWRRRRQQEEERRSSRGYGGRRRLSYRAPSTDDEDSGRAHDCPDAAAPQRRKRLPYRPPSSCGSFNSDRSASDGENLGPSDRSAASFNDDSRADVRDELRGPPPSSYYRLCY